MESKILQRLDSIEASLGGLREKPLSFDEAAIYVGISKSYLYKLTSAGRIPHYKPEGKRLYFDRAELNAWVFRNPVGPAVDQDQAATDYLTSSPKR